MSLAIWLFFRMALFCRFFGISPKMRLPCQAQCGDAIHLPTQIYSLQQDLFWLRIGMISSDIGGFPD